MRKLKLYEKIYLYIALPFSLVQILFSLLTMPKDKHIFHSGKPLSGIKKSSITKDLSLEDLRKKSRDLGVTINDILMTLTSITLK